MPTIVYQLIVEFFIFLANMSLHAAVMRDSEVDPQEQEKVIPDKRTKPDINKVESSSPSGLFFSLVITLFDEALSKKTEQKGAQNLQLLKLLEEVVTTPVLEMANI